MLWKMPDFPASGVAATGKWAHNGGPRMLPTGAGLTAISHQIDANRVGLMATVLGIYLFMHVVPFAEVQAVFLHIHAPSVALMCGIVIVMAAFTFRLTDFF